MFVRARLLRPLARTLLAKEWAALKTQLEEEYTRLLQLGDCHPPLTAQCLLVSGEDHRHRRHPGFDVIAICRALWRGLFLGLPEGASTIEQQIVRVLSNRYERTLSRKVREVLLATLVQEVVPKASMPAIYLEIGYFGWRMNGFQQACARLGQNPAALSVDQAASLVARLKYPQPRECPPARWQQIARRTGHLQALYSRHLLDGTYIHLTKEANAEALRIGRVHAPAYGAVS